MRLPQETEDGQARDAGFDLELDQRSDAAQVQCAIGGERRGADGVDTARSGQRGSRGKS